MQISFNEDLATYARDVLELFFGFNALDETWEEELQEDGCKCWTKGSAKSCIKPRIRRIEEAASCPTVSHAVAHCNDSSAPGGSMATGGGSNAGGTGS